MIACVCGEGITWSRIIAEKHARADDTSPRLACAEQTVLYLADAQDGHQDPGPVVLAFDEWKRVYYRRIHIHDRRAHSPRVPTPKVQLDLGSSAQAGGLQRF